MCPLSQRGLTDCQGWEIIPPNEDAPSFLNNDESDDMQKLVMSDSI